MRARLHASLLHLLASILAAALVAGLVFLWWFPWPYRELAGGRELFWLVVGVDVVMGPVLTFVVFNRRKSAGELRRDVAVIVALQLGALAYGMWSVAQARPVYLVYEVDRFRVVTAADIDPATLHQARHGLDRLPWTGPRLIAVRRPEAGAEMNQSIDLALRGIDLSVQPAFWVPFEAEQALALARARPLPQLIARLPAQAQALHQAAAQTGRAVEGLHYLPLTARSAFWTALVDPASGRPLGYSPVDPF